MNKLTVEECIESLEDNLFTNIEFTHKEDNSLFFTAYDTEEELNAEIQYEIEPENEEDTQLFIFAKYSNSEHYIVHSWYFLED